MRQPPNDVTAERSLLALLMATGQSYRVADRITSDDFFTYDHQTIYKAIISIDSNVDTNTVHAACVRVDSDWDNWNLIREIQNEAKREHAVADNMEKFADRVADLSLQRKYLVALVELTEAIFTQDLNGLDVEVFVDSKLRPLNDLALNREAEIKPWELNEWEELSKPMTSVSTGLSDLDRCTNGPNKSGVFVITGDPGSGKTTLAMNMALHANSNGETAGIISMEMSRAQLVQRLISTEARIPLDAVKNATPETEQKRFDSYERLCKAKKMYVDESDTRTVSDIKSQAMKLLNRAGSCDMLIVDYLGLMDSDSPTEKEHEKVASAIRGLKSIAKNMDISVVCLVQKNKAGELMGSSVIKQVCDVVIDVSRDELEPNTTNVKVIKAKFAAAQDFKLTFQGHFNRFENYMPRTQYSDTPSERYV